MPRTTARPYGQLTRDAIVDAAVAHLVDAGVESMTIRKLAGELGVSPMALYRHVDNKDDLLLDVTDRLLADAGLPSRSVGWRRCLLELAGSLQQLLHDHPDLVTVFNRGPVTTPAAVARMERAVEVLVRDGFSTDAAVESYGSVHIYTVGYSAIAAARRSSDASPDPDELDGPASLIARFVTPRQYRIGLEDLLAGIEARRAPRGRPAARRAST